MNCDWGEIEPKGGRRVFRCRREGCGNALFADSPDGCHADCKASCRHFGASLAPHLVRCESCAGRVMLKIAVNVCGVFGRCLPGEPAEVPAGYHPCRGCDRREPRDG